MRFTRQLALNLWVEAKVDGSINYILLRDGEPPIIGISHDQHFTRLQPLIDNALRAALNDLQQQYKQHKENT